jgi:hypothetical protein
MARTVSSSTQTPHRPSPLAFSNEGIGKTVPDATVQTPLPRPSTVAGLFTMGTVMGMVATALLGRGQWGQLAKPLEQAVEHTLEHSPPVPVATESAESLVHGLGEGASSSSSSAAGTTADRSSPSSAVKIGSFFSNYTMLFGAALNEPQLLVPVTAYWLSAGAGFLGANVLQGLQEAWVRREESCIRAELVAHLRSAFTQSINTKLQQDDTNRQTTTAQLTDSLTRHGVDHAEELVASVAGLPLPLQDRVTHRNFFYMPTNRSAPPAPGCVTPAVSPSFGGLQGSEGATLGPLPLAAASLSSASSPSTPSTDEKPWHQDVFLRHAKPLINTAAVVCGGATGYLLTYTAGHLKQALGQPRSTQPISTNYINLENAKASFVALFHGGHIKPLMGMLALGGLLGVGKQVITGLREVEVTRLNARTEENYEVQRWQQMDTMYHDVAETTQLNHLISQFDANVPMWKDNPARLKQEVAGILGAVGSLSPPPYYLVTPAVQLEAARS